MGKSIEFTPGFCIGTALTLLILPLRWILALTVAAVFHELCHVAVLRLCRIRIVGIRIGMGRAEISTETMMPGEELFCALAGPVGSFVLLLLIRAAPLIALCGLVQGLYNLLPVMPLDGGRVVNSILTMIYPSGAESIMLILRYGVMVLLILAGIAAAFVLENGFAVAVMLILLALKCFQGKIPCKEARKGVQ